MPVFDEFGAEVKNWQGNTPPAFYSCVIIIMIMMMGIIKIVTMIIMIILMMIIKEQAHTSDGCATVHDLLDKLKNVTCLRHHFCVGKKMSPFLCGQKNVTIFVWPKKCHPPT